MKRGRTTTKARPAKQGGKGAGERSEAVTPAEQPLGQPDLEPEVERAPERDVEVSRNEGASGVNDEESVHEPGADEWLDAELGPDQAVESSIGARRE